MTLITLPAETDAAAAGAALRQALEHSGPPVTVRRPGKPDLTVELAPGEMTQRLARLWGRFYTTTVHDGQIPAPQAGVETEDSRQRESALVSTPASGAGNHGLANRGGAVPATPFLLGKPAGVNAPAGRRTAR